MFSKEIPNQYRAMPFWSWNDRLEKDETARQIDKMQEAGIGGYVMHARGGLVTPYMEEEWFQNVETAIQEGKARGMLPWAYDENGWPSGFGSGAVCALGIEYQQKYLRMTEEEPSENKIGKADGVWFYYEVNPYYVDVCDKKVIQKFIEVAYEPYYKRFGNTFEGFFTDEPQISRKGIPWSFVFEKEYMERYGEALLPRLPELFLSRGDYKETRVRFWKMVTELFSTSYFEQIYNWCSARGLKLTGHLLAEESLSSQLTTSGAVMPHYAFMHIPGMDWLRREKRECLTANQVSSVCAQLGKKTVLSETFAMCGHGVSFRELRGIYEWQMVRGINLLCQHLEGYSMRGIRKRDFPPALFYQQPWWDAYPLFNTAMARIGRLLAEGEQQVEVLVLHPMTTAWSLFDGAPNAEIAELHQRLLKTMKTLEEKHVEYHLGDETLMAQYGSVQDGKLIVGKAAYSVVVDPGCAVLLPSTKRLLAAFRDAGGKVVSAYEVPQNPVTDNAEITYTKRVFPDFTMHYFVNSSEEEKTAKINIYGRKMDIYTGKLHAFSGCCTFAPWESLVLIENGAENVHETKNGREIELVGTFQIEKPVENILTLDRCNYYFDGALCEENGYVLNICERANALRRPVHIRECFFLDVAYLPEKITLALETPEKFSILVNGQEIEKTPEGYLLDKSFQTVDITKYLREGKNTIERISVFSQRAETYAAIEKAKHCETEKNKLAYDMEIEPMYLSGHFAVGTPGQFTPLPNNAVRYEGPFVIEKPPTEISRQNLERQGYPFFAGTMELSGEIEIESPEDVLVFRRKGINVLKASIGGKEKTLLFEDKLPLSEFGITGKARIRISITNNLRNALGPHHAAEGELLAVEPASFYKEPCIWNGYRENDFSEDYCFIETGF